MINSTLLETPVFSKIFCRVVNNASPELEEYFKIKELPQEFYLNSAVKIIDVPKFIETQLIQIKSQGIKSPAYDRLIDLKRLFDEESL